MRLLRGLGGRILPCGCLVGIYETYEGKVVATIDARGAACDLAGHELHSRLHDIGMAGRPPADEHTEPARR